MTDTAEKKVSKGKKETFMQGVVTLIFSQLLIKLLGLVYNLYLTNREGFGDQGNGIVSASYQIYAVLLTISSTGVPNAISKLVAERTAKGDHKGALRIFKVALAVFALIGLIGTLLLLYKINGLSVTYSNIVLSRLTYKSAILPIAPPTFDTFVVDSSKRDGSVSTL